MLNRTIPICIEPGGVPEIIYISQYDVGLQTFVFVPYTNNGTLTVPSGASATLEGTKPDGYAFVHNCTYNTSNGQITYTVQDQLAAVAGRVWSKLVIRDTSGNILGFRAIVWIVDFAGVKDGAVVSDSDISALEEFVNEFGTINAYKAALDGAMAAVGGPYVASTVAQMTDRTKVYVYTGSQTGYTAGHWYYWNGSAWTDGGVYQAAAVETDKTLAVTDMAADGKATGDAVAELKNELNADPDWQMGFHVNSNGTLGPLTENANYRSYVIKVYEGEVYKIYGKGTNAARLWSTHLEDGTTVRIAESSVDASQTPVELTIGSTEKYLCFNSSNNYNPHIYYYGGKSFYQNTRKYAEQIEQDENSLSGRIDVLVGAIDGGDLELVPVNIFDGNFPQTGYIDSDGADAASSAFKRTDYIQLDSFPTLYFLRTYQPYQLEVFFYNASKVFLGKVTAFKNANDTSLRKTVDIPETSAYIRMYTSKNYYSGNLEVGFGETASYEDFGTELLYVSEGKIDYEKLNSALRQSIADIDGIMVDAVDGEDANIFDGSFPENGYFDAQGADVSSTTFKRTDYIPIDGDQSTLYFLRTHQPYQIEACFYDSSKVAVSDRTTVFQNSWTTLRSSLLIPSGTAYVRMYTSVASYQPDLMLSYKDYPRFVEFGDKYYSLRDGTVGNRALTDDIVKCIKPLTGKTIVFMGDSIIGNFYDETGICAIMQEITGANIINCAFGGTRMAYRHGNTSGQIAEFARWDTISGAGLSDAISSGDWSAQEAAIPAMTSWKPAYFSDRLDTIEAVDWSNVDYILWEYGTNDFASNVALENDSDATDMYAYANAYRKTIETILTAYPNIRIISVTPFWRFWTDENDQYLYDSNTHEIADYQGVDHKLTDFVSKAASVSQEYQIACIDDYYTTCANSFTRLSFFDASDGTHPNADGRRRIAVHLAAQLMSLI